jgi:hypothetical protein
LSDERPRPAALSAGAERPGLGKCYESAVTAGEWHYEGAYGSCTCADKEAIPPIKDRLTPARCVWREAWDALHDVGRRWRENPLVWAITFERVDETK